jgi:quinol monooxygenase YgiN
MINGTLRILPSANRRGDVLEVLRSIQGPVLAQPGCAAFHIYEEQSPDEAVVLIERWESEAALEAHVRSEAFRRVLGAIELSDHPPEIWFDHVSASEGMELIERSRSPQSQVDGGLETHEGGSPSHDVADHRATHQAQRGKGV